MNEVEFRKTIDILHPNGEIFELRVIGGKQLMSGYFTSAEKAWEYVRQYPNETFYIIFNKIDDGCMSRLQGGQLLASNFNQKLSTTTDKDIVRRKWVFIDIDTKKPTAVSATDEEKTKALKTTRTVFKFLRNMGFEEPIIFDSGNGYGMYLSVDLPIDNDTTAIIKKFVETIALLFDDENCDIDTSVFNLSRLSKCVPTIAKKGRSTKDRPHRESKYIYIPDQIKSSSIQLFKQVIESVTPPEEDAPNFRNNYKAFDIRGFIQKHGISVSSETVVNGITKLVLSECVFDHSHKAPDSALFIMPSGAISYKCFHNSCSDKSWKDVRSHFEPDWLDIKRKSQTATPNYKHEEYKPTEVKKLNGDNGQPDFYTMPQIAALPEQERKLIPTGYKELDKKLGGLAKGEVSVISARNGAGKSTLITQMYLNMIDSGYRVALFSGELTAQRARKWSCQIAAGKRNAIQSKYGDGYYITDETRTKIDTWLDKKMFIYNNNNGNNFTRLCEKLNQCVINNKVDVIYIDNLASLDISELSQNEYEAQKKFINIIVAFAQANNIHILLVLHPRKEIGVINKYSISGSADLSNRVDVCILLHRVTDDFKREVQANYHWKSDNPLLEAGNIIEITKDRENGTVDYFIPLYYEPESHRLNESRYDSKIYGWQKSNSLDELPM